MYFDKLLKIYNIVKIFLISFLKLKYACKKKKKTITAFKKDTHIIRMSDLCVIYGDEKKRFLY